MKSSVRRIIGLGDSGEDVRVVQHMLNLQLSFPTAYAQRLVGFQEMSERDCPGLWGYEWGEGGRKQFFKRHLDNKTFRRPHWENEGSPHLAEDGLFGPKTEKAVIRFQRRCGLPDDGVVGPETWTMLFPLCSVTILVARDTPKPINLNIPGFPSLPSLPVPQQSPERKTEFDNIAGQMGVQLDKNGLSGVMVLQATWKTSRLPDEFLPGHWEHTGGAQLVSPYGRNSGKNLQAYYQLSRAEVLELELTDELKITADLWVQPFIQVPLDKGSPGKPNLPQAGVNVGGTVQLEYKADEDSPTIKVFVQGAGGGTVDSRGGFDGGGQFVAGVSVEVDPEMLLFGGGKIPKAGPVQPQEIRAEPAFVQIKRGGSANFRLVLKKTAQQAAMLNFSNMPEGVSVPFPGIGAYSNSTVVSLTADANAPLTDTMIQITYDATTNPKKIEILTTYVRLEVVP